MRWPAGSDRPCPDHESEIVPARPAPDLGDMLMARASQARPDEAARIRPEQLRRRPAPRPPGPSEPWDGMSLADVAGVTGVSARVVYRYEETGLLPPVPRQPTAGRKRVYGPEHAAAICEIRRMTEHGLTLAQIKAIRDEG